MKDRISTTKIDDAVLLNSNQFVDFKKEIRDRTRPDALTFETGEQTFDDRAVCRTESKAIGTCRLGYRCPYIHPIADRSGQVPQHLIHIHTSPSEEVLFGTEVIIKRLDVDKTQIGFTYRIIGYLTNEIFEKNPVNVETIKELDKSSDHFLIQEILNNIYPQTEEKLIFRQRAPSVMELVVVKTENGWRRGRVVFLSGMESRILLIDEGREEVVPIEKVFRFDEDLLRFPAQAKFAVVCPELIPIPNYTDKHIDQIEHHTSSYMIGKVVDVKMLNRLNSPIVAMRCFIFLVGITKKKIYTLDKYLCRLGNENGEPLFEKYESVKEESPVAMMVL